MNVPRTHKYIFIEKSVIWKEIIVLPIIDILASINLVSFKYVIVWFKKSKCSAKKLHIDTMKTLKQARWHIWTFRITLLHFPSTSLNTILLVHCLQGFYYYFSCFLLQVLKPSNCFVTDNLCNWNSENRLFSFSHCCEWYLFMNVVICYI